MVLVPGSEVVLISPAFAVEQAVAQQAMRYWQQMGMVPILMPNALGKHGAFSGTDAERRADFVAALEHPTARAIHCLRGGYGLTRILDQLPLELLQGFPKYLIGFSDITAGLLAWQALGFGHLAVHAPMAGHLTDTTGTGTSAPDKAAPDKNNADKAAPDKNNPDKAEAGTSAPDASALATYLQTGTFAHTWAHPSADTYAGTWLHAPLTGGNLTLLAHTVGTRYQLHAQGKILFLEEVGEQLYHTDRMLLQLRRAGALEGVRAVLLGHFTDMKDLPQGYGQTLKEIVLEHMGAVPIAAGYPAGHAQPNYLLPYSPVVLAAEAGSWLVRIST